MTTYITRATSVVVAPEDAPLYSEMATTVTIVDEAAGEFVEVEQHGRADVGKISISPEEWPELRTAIDVLIAACRPDKDRAPREIDAPIPPSPRRGPPQGYRGGA